MNEDAQLSLQSGYMISDGGCLSMGEVKKQEEILRSKLSENPRDGFTWAALGQVLHLQGRFEEAQEAYERAVSIEQKAHLAWLGLATFAYQRNELDKAVDLMKKSVKAKDDYLEGWVSLGQLFVRLNKHKDARKAFEKVVKINPESVEGWHGLSIANLHLGKYDEATTAIERALQLETQDIDLWLAYSAISRQKKEFTTSERALKRVIELNPKEVHDMIGLALALSQHDRTMQTEAIKFYQKAVALKPDEPMAWIELIKLLRQHKRDEEADMALRKAYPHLPDSIRRSIPEPSKPARFLDGRLPFPSLGDAGPSKVYDVKSSSDGRYLLFRGENTAVAVWDIKQMKTIFEWVSDGKIVSDMALSPNGKLLAVGQQASASVIDIGSSKVLNTFDLFESDTYDPNYPMSLARKDPGLMGYNSVVGFSADGNHLINFQMLLFSGPVRNRPKSMNHTVVWDHTVSSKTMFGPGAKFHDLTKSYSFLGPFKISPDYKWIAFRIQSRGRLGSIQDSSIDIMTLDSVLKGIPETVTSLSRSDTYDFQFSPDSRHLAAATSKGLIVWKTESGEEVFEKSRGKYTNITWDPEGGYILCDNIVHSAESGEKIVQLSDPNYQLDSGRVLSVASRHNPRSFVVSATDGIVRFYRIGDEINLTPTI